MDTVISNWSDSGVDEDKPEPSAETAVESAVTEYMPVVDGNTSADDDGHMYVSF